MKIFRKVKINGLKTAVAIGFFDGVHIGHRKVIKKAVDSGFLPVVLTFDYENDAPKSKGDIKFITSNRVKFCLFKELGVKIVDVPHFESVKNIEFVDFFEEILVKDLNAKILVCGKNLRFGRNRMGNVNSLKKLSKENDIEVYDVNLVKLHGEYVSSKRIRNVVKMGNLSLLKELLGYNYYIELNFKDCFFSEEAINYKISKNMAFLKNGYYVVKVKINNFSFEAVAKIKEYNEYFLLKLYIKNTRWKDIEKKILKVIFMDLIRFCWFFIYFML